MQQRRRLAFYGQNGRWCEVPISIPPGPFLIHGVIYRRHGCEPLVTCPGQSPGMWTLAQPCRATFISQCQGRSVSVSDCRCRSRTFAPSPLRWCVVTARQHAQRISARGVSLAAFRIWAVSCRGVRRGLRADPFCRLCTFRTRAALCTRARLVAWPNIGARTRPPARVENLTCCPKFGEAAPLAVGM